MQICMQTSRSLYIIIFPTSFPSKLLLFSNFISEFSAPSHDLVHPFKQQGYHYISISSQPLLRFSITTAMYTGCYPACCCYYCFVVAIIASFCNDSFLLATHAAMCREYPATFLQYQSRKASRTSKQNKKQQTEREKLKTKKKQENKIKSPQAIQRSVSNSYPACR